MAEQHYQKAPVESRAEAAAAEDKRAKVMRELTVDNVIDAVIVDRSGSTAGAVIKREALECGKACTEASAAAAAEGTKVALLSFASEATFDGCKKAAEVHKALLELSAGGGTCTDLGFEELQRNLDRILDQRGADRPVFSVLLCTDGQMNSGRDLPGKVSNLKAALAAKGFQLRVHMLTVLCSEIDNTDVAVVASAAGGDVLAHFQDPRSGDTLWSFKSVSLHGPDHEHFSRFLPRDKEWLAFDKNVVFPVSQLPEFLATMLPAIVASVGGDEMRQMRIVQNLGWLLKAIAERDPEVQTTSGKIGRVINAMSMAFKGASGSFSPSEVSRLLLGMLEELNVIYLAAVKAKRRQLFAEAQAYLKDDTVAATGMSRGMTLPLNCLGASLILHDIASWNVTERAGERASAAIMFSGKCCTVIPYMPIPGEAETLPFLESQCTRQLLRIVAAGQYHVHQESDTVVYLYLVLLLQMQLCPDVPDSVKEAFRNLCITLLKKKRTNEVDLTEIAALRSAQPPISSNPNFSFTTEEFLGQILQSAAFYLGLTLDMDAISPLTWWWAICLALNDEQILKGQKNIVEAAVSKDAEGSDIPTSLTLLLDSPKIGKAMDSGLKTSVRCVSLATAENKGVEYFDPVTLADTTTTGGFAIRPHGSCRKLCVCQEKYTLPTGCFWCHAHVGQADYMEIGPKLDQASSSFEPANWALTQDVPKTPLKTLLFQSRQNPIPGQIVVKASDYVSGPEWDINTLIDKVSDAIGGGVPAGSLQTLLRSVPNICISGSIIPRLLRDMPTDTDVDFFIYGTDEEALKALNEVSDWLDLLCSPYSIIHQGGVVTVTLKYGNIPMQFVRISAEDYPTLDDYVKGRPAPVCQYAFSPNLEGGILCSVEFLEWYKSKYIQWWQLNHDRGTLRHALRYQLAGFDLCEGLLEQMASLSEELGVDIETCEEHDTSDAVYAASIDDLPEEVRDIWVVGIRKGGKGYQH